MFKFIYLFKKQANKKKKTTPTHFEAYAYQPLLDKNGPQCMR